ncbi:MULTISPECIES: cytochrome o ubiquinol oxidase subunit IV [unclassified Beijerinckia]|uniref:cytochrome o ubiquinol oxidase subunit IV n=1 Tax=unclassified Beijerinckia TaxID=2638183 RepID=UPI00089D4D95|nr:MULTISPECIES: cytochrome o ubiquinol oxidase subunit IV [unclassified Beijerinckia]MDH7794699.1 cytochrome o ubiquinol oxidase operon protein cyoD [Beijerinckia sp. GAS462]SEB71829.1 cytochrome bb3 quinol oxidase subunit 4 [Beijerinckia sp. 28-YEA-48]
MSNHHHNHTDWHTDTAPGDQEGDHHDIAGAVRNYLIGFVLAAALTAGSFWVASGTSFIYTPGVPMALAALAIGQMGVHLAFFLHITTGPDNTNNVIALAFGVLIVGIVIAGSLWIMYHLNANMMVPGNLMDMRMQPGL